jgi:hypothetical protein
MFGEAGRGSVFGVGAMKQSGQGSGRQSDISVDGDNKTISFRLIYSIEQPKRITNIRS